MIDTHAHLDDDQFAGDLEEVLGRAREAGVEAIICPGITAASSEAVVQLAERHPMLLAAVGIQPNYVGEAAADDFGRVERLVQRPRVVGIGETGLDRHWDFTPLDLQQEHFDRHLRLAQEHDLPVIIHCREAEDDTLAMLREAISRGPLRAVMHAFSGDEAFAQACLDLGLYVSFAGAVTYRNKKFQSLRAAARTVPDDRLLVETDSPYLVPHPFRGKIKRNEPANVVHTLRDLADLRGQSVDQLIALTTANARRLFPLA